MAGNKIRTPRARILANGVPLAGIVAIDIASNNHAAADRFSVSLALSANPGLLGSEPDLALDLGCALDGQTYVSLVTGRADSLSLDPIRGTGRLNGRDRTADLIDSRTQETFANRTSSEIAIILAQRHGLAARVTQTTTLVGRYYQAEHDRITLNSFSHATTEWDLLTTLAGQEGFDVYITGDTLVFAPPAPPSTPVAITPNDCLDLRLDRALTLARDISVTVKSWNTNQNTAFSQTARAAGTGSRAGGPPQKYVYVVPNLSTQAALQLAQQRLAELSAHERVITLTMPGELTLTPRDPLALSGTGSAFDQTYLIDRIDRRLSLHDGFVQTIRAKNITPLATATIPTDRVTGIAGL